MNRLALFRAYVDQSQPRVVKEDHRRISDEAFQKFLEPHDPSSVDDQGEEYNNAVPDLCPAIQILDQECVESPKRSFLTNSLSFEKNDSTETITNTKACNEIVLSGDQFGQEI